VNPPSLAQGLDHLPLQLQSQYPPIADVILRLISL
jgi:hypothetical protein